MRRVPSLRGRDPGTRDSMRRICTVTGLGYRGPVSSSLCGRGAGTARATICMRTTGPGPPAPWLVSKGFHGHCRAIDSRRGRR